jgi:hypothetical protein
MIKQKVYIPANGEQELAVCYFSRFEEWTYKEGVKEIDAFVFTPEELKKLLEDYTNKIVGGVKTKNEYWEGLDDGENVTVIDKESITQQLNLLLKKLGLNNLR